MAFQSPNYTQTPNDLFDDLLKQVNDLSELKVTLAAIRMTLGYHVKQAELSQDYLEKMTGLSRNSVRRGLALALRRGSIVIVKKSTNRTGGIYALNFGGSANARPEGQPRTPLKKEKEINNNNNNKAPVAKVIESPKANFYDAYHKAFGEFAESPTVRNELAVSEVEAFPKDYIDEAFLRTAKRERASGEHWRQHQRIPYALQLLNEWAYRGSIQAEPAPKKFVPCPTYPRSGAPPPTKPKLPLNQQLEEYYKLRPDMRPRGG